MAADPFHEHLKECPRCRQALASTCQAGHVALLESLTAAGCADIFPRLDSVAGHLAELKALSYLLGYRVESSPDGLEERLIRPDGSVALVARRRPQ